MKKRIIFVLLSIVLSFVFVACGDSSSNDSQLIGSKLSHPGKSEIDGKDNAGNYLDIDDYDQYYPFILKLNEDGTFEAVMDEMDTEMATGNYTIEVYKESEEIDFQFDEEADNPIEQGRMSLTFDDQNKGTLSYEYYFYLYNEQNWIDLYHDSYENYLDIERNHREYQLDGPNFEL